MNIEYAHELVSLYEEDLEHLKAIDYDFDCAPDTHGESGTLCGAKSMLARMHEFLDENKIGKFNRWLGFVQAMLFVAGYYSINEMREHNTPLED